MFLKRLFWYRTASSQTPERQTRQAIADVGANGSGQSAPDDKFRAARWQAIKKPAADFPARALKFFR
jgi:hypothetical protein